MTDRQPNIFTRDDTFFGVCEALGEDFGFHANWLRLGLAGASFFAPVQVIAVYAVLGVAVAVSRWIFPAPVRPVRAVAESLAESAQVATPVAAGLFGAMRPTQPEEVQAVERELLPMAA